MSLGDICIWSAVLVTGLVGVTESVKENSLLS